MSGALLTFQDVSFGYVRNRLPVIQGLNIQLKQGGITTILGPNGAGKTTLLSLSLGWLKPWAGKIFLGERPLEQYSRRALGKQIALIPQSEHIPFEYSALEYVLLGRAPYLPPLGMPSAGDEQLAYEALEKVGMGHLYDQSMLGLSGGERQLVLAARALAQDPRILLLDEPTSHLDLSNKYRMVRILQGLQKQGVTILMTTHEPEQALLLSDDVILMEKGHVFASGPKDEVATSEHLSRVYGVPVRIVSLEGKSQVLWM